MSTVDAVGNALEEAELAVHEALVRDDDWAYRQENERAARLRRMLARIDPRGVGAPHLDLLPAFQRNAVLNGRRE